MWAVIMQHPDSAHWFIHYGGLPTRASAVAELQRNMQQYAEYDSPILRKRGLQYKRKVVTQAEAVQLTSN